MIALLVIGILVVLIVVHEFGHFITAKIFGVRVDEFGVGYPPRAFLLAKFGGTEYTLNWLPFGGFVRLYGEEDQHGKGSLVDAARWKQAIILVAGVFMNAVAAWLLFSGAYITGILHAVDEPSATSMLVVSSVVASSPAAIAGIQPGDQIIAVESDGASGAVLTPSGVSDFISARGGGEISVTYVHAGATTTSTVRPAHAVIAQEAGRPAIGVGLLLADKKSLGVAAALSAGFYHTLDTFVIVSKGLWTILSGVLQGEPNLKDVVGPVGLVGAVGEAAHEGWGYVLSLAAFISVNLAIINLIPIPALDGGRLLLVGIEGVIRRSASKSIVQILNVVGVALVIALMVTVTYQDISRLFT